MIKFLDRQIKLSLQSPGEGREVIDSRNLSVYLTINFY